MRLSRRAVLLVAVGVVVMSALFVTGATSSAAPDTRSGVGAALVARPDALPATAARLEPDRPHQLAAAQRSAKHALALFGVALALLAVPALFARGASTSLHARPVLAWRSLSSRERGPPLLQLSVI